MSGHYNSNFSLILQHSSSDNCSFGVNHLGSNGIKDLHCCFSVAKSLLTPLRPHDCKPPGSSVHGILQAGMLEWVTTSFSRGSSQPRDQTQVSSVAGGFFLYHWKNEPPASQKDLHQSLTYIIICKKEWDTAMLFKIKMIKLVSVRFTGMALFISQHPIREPVQSQPSGGLMIRLDLQISSSPQYRGHQKPTE